MYIRVCNGAFLKGACATCENGQDLWCRQIDCKQLHSSINQQLIAGHFGHEGLRQLHTKQGFVAKMSCNLLLIDTAM